jgi:predicted RNA binding protein YcfA (HicA-like mRNA interferase family)
MKTSKLLQKALASPNNLRFAQACALAEGYGFHLSRVKGSHHIYAHPEVQELVNLQDVGGHAKAYQLRQLLQLIERYNLKSEGVR